MAKISALTDGSTPQGANDQIPVARSGANRRLSVGSFPIVQAKWGVPCILASSGSMANNGAVSGMTALPTTYSGGAWLYLPANAIQAGSAAGFYWFVASSTTAGTVYNSTFDGTSVPGLGTTTAFVSTGPGAFTGIAAGEIVCATVTIAANSVGTNGQIQLDAQGNHNTAAGNKIYRVRYSGAAGTSHVASTQSTSAAFYARAAITNGGVTNIQKGTAYAGNTGGVGAMVAYGAADTTASTTLVFTLEKATATNHAIWEGATVLLIYGA